MGDKTLTILICTHNRAELLQRALGSLQDAERPAGWEVVIFVAANACSDGTHALLEAEKKAGQEDPERLALEWIAEPSPGKSYALNSAIPHVKSSAMVAFVDDDHRVAPDFLCAIARAADDNPAFTMFSGKILPEWDGSEPKWVHDEGPYKIRPSPVPKSDGGPTQRELTGADNTPGGGNLSIRGKVFDSAGPFPTELGPHGHDLGGGEDSAFIHKALNKGHRLLYVPDIIQYHYVDPARLKFRYVLRKAYNRARSDAANKNVRTGVPVYLWKKLAQYLAQTLFSFGAARLRFFLLRTTATLGEIAGISSTKYRRSARPAERRRNRLYVSTILLTLVAGLGTAYAGAPGLFHTGAGSTLVAAALFTLLLGAKAMADFSHTGPRLNKEIFAQFRLYAVLAFLRLLLLSLLILVTLAGVGVTTTLALESLLETSVSYWATLAAGVASILVLSALQFCRQLLFLPASIAVSYNYRISRLYPLWHRLTPGRLRVAAWLLLGIPALVTVTATGTALADGRTHSAAGFGTILLFYGLIGLWLRPRRVPAHKARKRSGRPNILMIGADTLRSDRLDGSYHRDVAPFLRQKIQGATFFDQCYVPCARTAPSLLSIFAGVWPQRLGVRDNFVTDAATELSVECLPQQVKQAGYRTAALSDWCGADMAKFSMGFDYTDVPDDQWNIKLFIRQGPKDLRMFLVLFCLNDFGKYLLPEIHYLGGIPQTDAVGREARYLIDEFAQGDEPFLLNVFFSTTHGPFGSEYPYYTRYAPTDYDGESKFVMSRVNDPWEIIRRQAEPKEEFDLDQIIDLYDGCVTRFDDEVRAIMAHLQACDLADHTIVVIYSDHGMEFFEHHTWGQGNSAISDVSSRIPLVIMSPEGRGGGTVSTPVRSIDIAPTLLELAGLTPPADIDGVSLAPFVDDGKLSRELEIYNETGIWITDLPGMPENHLRYPDLLELLTVRDLLTGTISIKPEYEQRVIQAKDRMIRIGKWKLVYQPLNDGYLLKLFDLAKDPDCLDNVAAIHPDIAAKLWHKLRQLAGQELVYATDHPPADAAYEKGA